MDERLLLEADLRRLNRIKRTDHPVGEPLGPEVAGVFKLIDKRHRKLGGVSEVWGTLVPQLIQEHVALEGFSRGVLTVLVDSSAHLYDLKQLLLAGLEKQILLACRSQGLRKITLKSGTWREPPPARRVVE
jgi:hypothetical protein